jgi:hypothetical protein
MRLPRSITLDGRQYLWQDLVALRRGHAQPRAAQPTLFELLEDHRPPGERTAAERYCEPNLFTVLEWMHESNLDITHESAEDIS